MPLAVAQLAVTTCGVGADRLTLNVAAVVPLLPSATVTSPMLKLGCDASA